MESSSYRLQQGPTFQPQKVRLQGNPNRPLKGATFPPPPPPPPPPRRRQQQQQEDVREGADQRQPTNNGHFMRTRPDKTPPGSASKKSHFFSLHGNTIAKQQQEQQSQQQHQQPQHYDADPYPYYYNNNTPSPQHQIRTSMSPTVRALEIMEEELSEKSGVASWTKRISWMRNKNHAAVDDVESSVSHLRSAWSTDSFLSLSKSQTLTTPTSTATKHTWRSQQQQQQQSTTSQQPPPLHPNSVNQQQPPYGSKPMVRSVSNASHLSVAGAPFGNGDWTPQDSAYGAACPVCGCLPKHVRRLIEVTLITVFIFGFIYLLITTSIRITNEHGNSNSGSGGGGGSGSNSGSSSGGTEQNVQLDDDYYVENTAAAYYADDDVAVADDYFADDAAAADDAASNHYYSNAADDDINKKESDDAFYAADDDGANARRQRFLRQWHNFPDPFSTIMDLI